MNNPSQTRFADLLNETHRTLLADTMTRNRARFGGYVMELDGSTGDEGSTDTGPEAGQEAPSGPQKAEQPTTDASPQEGDEGGSEAEDGRIKKANAEAARYRTERNEIRAELDSVKNTLESLAKVLNPDAETTDAPTAEELAADVTAKDTKIAELTAQVTVLRSAAAHNADASKLLDRVSFVTALNGLDAAGDTYAADVEALIKKTIADDPALMLAKAPAGNAGIPPGTPGQTTTVTQAEFDAMNASQLTALFKSDPVTYKRLSGT